MKNIIKNTYKRMIKLLFAALIFLTGCENYVSTAEKTTQIKTFKPKTVTVFVTAKDTDLLIKNTEKLKFQSSKQPLGSQPFIFVDPEKTFQTIEGIGAALTDASAETFYKMPKNIQQKIITSYFDSIKGIDYNFARTNMASCDFSSESYNYVEEKDIQLKTFNVKHDEKYRIPFIKKAIKEKNGKLKLFISPWSPPAWMKDNNSILHGGKLLDQYKQCWANYFVKFIQEYENHGIPIWGLSVQNEPMASQSWESCIYTAKEECDFIKTYLGPTLWKNGMKDKKLIAWDHNRDMVYQRACTILRDPDAEKYVWGIGYHWYEGVTGNMQFENVKLVTEAFPKKKVLFTEGCAERFDSTRIHAWTLGEKYGYSMLNDFKSGAVAWTDWNILLDETGGPNHVGNLCFAPVHANTKTGKLIYTNIYYYIGQFSKFIKAGAKRIIASSNRINLETTAFINPNGSIVTIVLNRTENKYKYQLIINDKETNLESLPHSIMTLVINPEQ